MAQNETIVFYAKDFFGDAVEASITFYQYGKVIHKTTFIDGRTEIKMPQQLEPGVYDIVASRETGEYRVNNIVIAMASHYFKHAIKHNDIKLKDGNIKDKEVIDKWKFNPIIYNHLFHLPSNAKEIFDKLVNYSSNPEGMRWGGMINLRKDISVSRGEAYINRRLVAWRETKLDIPDIGIYNIGIKNGSIVVSKNPLDYRMAILRVDSNDWVRLNSESKYHCIQKGNDLFFFSDFELSSEDIVMEIPSEISITGIVIDGKAYGLSRSSAKGTSVKVDMVGDGPVLNTDRLYVYATTEYFLLWENDTLLTALPRWSGSHIMLDWSDGIVFSSWGNNGSSRWSSNIPYSESYPVFRQGNVPIQSQENLKNILAGFVGIAKNNQFDWSQSINPGATLVWNTISLRPSS